MSLLSATQKMLRETRRHHSLRDIAPEGGAVDHEWLKKFSAGKIDDPSVNRIQALHDRLLRMRVDAHAERASTLEQPAA